MNETLELYPALPELLLAGGAMVLLMIGAYEGNRATAPVLHYSVVLLVLAGVTIAAMPDERMTTFGGALLPPTPQAKPNRGAQSPRSWMSSCVSNRSPPLNVMLGRTRQSSCK